MYKNLKKEHLAARKERSLERMALLVGVISDVDDKVIVSRKAAEAAGEEHIIPDSIVLATLKNQIKNLNKGISDTLANVGECSAAELMREKVRSLSVFLPPALEGDELRLLIQDLGASNLGQAMGLLKKMSEVQGFDFDGREASSIAKEIFV